ncbi:MAG: SWIM zinc finger domain-containing protein [Elainella sp.]
MPSSFSKLITPAQLKSLADGKSYQRGEAYFRQGQVHSLAEQDEVIAAQVEGTETYEVEFWIEDAALAYQCDCPVGIDGWFCKHCVAVGLSWLADPPDQQTKRSAKAARSANKMTTMQDVQQYLEQQDKASLIKLVLDQAMKNSEWREQLLMKVAAAQPGGVDLKTFQRAFKTAVTPRGEIDYYQVKNYARSIGKVIDSFSALLETGQAETLITLCEWAVPLLEQAICSVDDSNGYLGALLSDLQELHYQACEQAKPDPIQLAERLFQLELASSFDPFYGAADTYADILGKAGIERYRRLAEAAWAELPDRDSSRRSGFDLRRHRLSHILELLARQTGNLEAVVAVKRRDLSSAYTYWEIAQLYQKAGDPDQALQWAEAGLKAFPDRTDRRLRDFAIQAYLARGRSEDAAAIAWARFVEYPSLDHYQGLKTVTHQGAAPTWKRWRQQALDHIRQQIKARQPYSPMAYHYRDHSLLVEIFLWEGEIELAWKEAKAGQCSQALWLQLADSLQADHPAESIALYQKAIEPLIQQTNNDAYASAVELLRKVKALMTQLKQTAQYEKYVSNLRVTYKNKRNFIKLLNIEAL